MTRPVQPAVVEEPAQPQFKVGDRVRAIKDCGMRSWAVEAGTEGRVVWSDDGVSVLWDGWETDWLYEASDLELIPPAPDTVTIPRMSEEDARALWRRVLSETCTYEDDVVALLHALNLIRPTSPLEALYAAHPDQREVIDAAFAIGKQSGDAK